LALHHLETAQQNFLNSGGAQRSALLEVSSEDYSESIIKAKQFELRDQFQRKLLPEILSQVFSLFDCPTLATSVKVCKSWRSIIFKSTQIFQHFEMEGNCREIIQGIKWFNLQSHNSIQTLRLRIQDPIRSVNEKKALEDVMKLNIQHLREITVSHHGELGKMIFDLANQCPNLSSLSSKRYENENRLHPPTPDSQIVKFDPLSFKQIRKLEWMCGSLNISGDGGLLKVLGNAQVVHLGSSEIKANWLINLLSTNKNLRSVRMPWIFTDMIKEMPRMFLPHLKLLTLGRIPKSHEENSEAFFKNLITPNLKDLRVCDLKPLDLSHLSPESSPESFLVEELHDPVSNSNASREAIQLIQSMKSWTRLKSLTLRLQKSMVFSFWDTLISVLTPTERLNSQAGFGSSIPLPRLESLIFGRRDATVDDPRLNSVILSDMVFIRKVLNQFIMDEKRGTAKGSSRLLSKLSGYRTVEHCSEIQYAQIWAPIQGDRDFHLLLRSMMSKLEIKNQIED
jgi:hypothetical protein